MAGFTSFATQAFQVLGAANTVLGALNNFQEGSGGRAYDLQKMQNQVALQNAQTQAAYEKQKLTLDAQSVEAERRAALRRAVAKQRAVYGASGIDSGSGSAQAVLLGKIDESEDERQRREALDSLKSAALDDSVSQQQRINTLKLTQLKEKNKYNAYASAFDAVSELGGLMD